MAAMLYQGGSPAVAASMALSVDLHTSSGHSVFPSFECLRAAGGARISPHADVNGQPAPAVRSLHIRAVATVRKLCNLAV